MPRAETTAKKVDASKAAKPEKTVSHPPFIDMVAEAIKSLSDKRGSSKIAIKKHMLAQYKLEDTKANNTRINLALKRGVTGGKLVTNRFYAGHFKNIKADKAAKKEPLKKTPVKKVAAKTPTKKLVKKAKSPTKKSVMKSARKTLTKKAAKPKLIAKKPAVKKTTKNAVKKPAKKATPKK